jgi:DNA topoisomerase-1
MPDRADDAARILAAKLEQRAARLSTRAAGLRRVKTDQLRLQRRRRGAGFVYLDAEGKPLRDAGTIRRLKSLAVPPAYEDVRYAEDPRAHIQAIGRDAAGRLQYRYHPDWEKVREKVKARHLIDLIKALPRIRRRISQQLATLQPTRELAFAAVIELVSRTAIRPGSETYARNHGTRGAATLLKTNVVVRRDAIALKFRGKGGREVQKEFRAARLAAALRVLGQLPGRRLFQYRDEAGEVRHITRREVNAFLHEMADVRISLKDFRTLVASGVVLETLARTEPARSAQRRRRQVLDAVRTVADELANTAAVCRRSYVHDTVFAAFENGVLQRYSATLKGCRSPAPRERVLARVIAATA